MQKKKTWTFLTILTTCFNYKASYDIEGTGVIYLLGAEIKISLYAYDFMFIIQYTK